MSDEQRTYTEAEVFALFQKFREEERNDSQKSNEERVLPEDIVNTLESFTQQQFQEHYKKFKRGLTKYIHKDWTVGEETNGNLIPKLKNYWVETTHVVNALHKGAEHTRYHARAATEIYERLRMLTTGQQTPAEAHRLLEEAMDLSGKLAICTWGQAQEYDEDAKQYALKALKLPPSLKHLEKKTSGNKRDAFSSDFLEAYNEANYQLYEKS